MRGLRTVTAQLSINFRAPVAAVYDRSTRLRQASLRRIAHFKSLTKPPLNFDPKRLQELSMEIAELNRKLNYAYGGKI